MVAVVQREWASKNPRASFRELITVEDVLKSRMIAYPFHLLECCLVTDGGGALILVSGERARDFPRKPVYVIGTGESVETPMVSQMEDLTSSRAFRVAGPARDEVGRHQSRRRAPHDDLRRVRASADLWSRGSWLLSDAAKQRVSSGKATRALAASCPSTRMVAVLSYMHSGMYGMYALQESVRQLRGVAPAQVDGAEISLCLGVGGMFGASGCVVMSNIGP